MQLIKAQNIRTLALSETWISYSILQELGDPEGRRGRKILGGKFSGWLQGNNVFRASYKYEFPAVLKHEQEQCNLNSEKKNEWGKVSTKSHTYLKSYCQLIVDRRQQIFFLQRGSPQRWTILHWKGTHSRTLWAAHTTYCLWYFKNNNNKKG